MSPGLALRNDFPQQVLKHIHVVMLVPSHRCTTHPHTRTDRSVIELIGNHKTAFTNQRRDRSRVGSITHRDDHGGFDAEKLGNEFFTL